MTIDGNKSDAGKWVLLVGGWVLWNAVPEETRQGIRQSIHDAFAAEQQRRVQEQQAYERRRREWQLQQQALQQQASPSLKSVPVAGESPTSRLVAPLVEVRPGAQTVGATSAPAPARPSPSPAELLIAQLASAWRKVIVHPAVVLVLGRRGSGKSALAYWLLEVFHYELACYVVGVPTEAGRYLPDWVGIRSSLDGVPRRAVILVDEAHLPYHARTSTAAASIEMSRLVNLARQREQTLLFVTQEARQVDRNIASSASVVVFKEPSSIQVSFERPELRRRAEEALAQFQIVRGDKRSWAFVYAPDADSQGMLENPLPSFWTPKLSHLFAAGQGGAPSRQPRRPTVREKALKARQLRDRGWSLKQIAKELAVSKATVVNYVRGYQGAGSSSTAQPQPAAPGSQPFHKPRVFGEELDFIGVSAYHLEPEKLHDGSFVLRVTDEELAKEAIQYEMVPPTCVIAVGPDGATRYICDPEPAPAAA